MASQIATIMDCKNFFYRIYVVLIALPIFVVFTIITALIAAFGAILGAERTFGYWPGVIWSRVTLALLLIPVSVKGKEHLPKDRATVVTPNHTSALDIFLLYGYSGVRFKWVMKGAIRKIPFVGWSCEKLGFIFVDNTPSGGTKVVDACEYAIDTGYHIFIFPEGTRSGDGKLSRLKKGAFKIAKETHAPIVPAKIRGGYEILRRGSWLINWGKLSLEFFAPIETNQGQTIEDLMEEVRTLIG